MAEKKTLTIMLVSAPFSTQYEDHMCRVALRALDKGHAVEIFLYGDAVHAQMNNQSPKLFFPVGEKIKELIAKGAKVYSCEICSVARGYISGQLKPDGTKDYTTTKVIDGVQFTTIFGRCSPWQRNAADNSACSSALYY